MLVKTHHGAWRAWIRRARDRKRQRFWIRRWQGRVRHPRDLGLRRLRNRLFGMWFWRHGLLGPWSSGVHSIRVLHSGLPAN